MKRVEKILADYIIHENMVDEADRTVYEYGFHIALEVGLFALFSLIIAVYLDMFIEGILFFVIFSPLRSYAGGLHLKRFWTCFILSCLTYTAILLVVKNIRIPIFVSFLALVLFSIAVCAMYPVENFNRKVDVEENVYFKAKLFRFLCMDILLGIICIVFAKDDYLFEIAIIFFTVAFTMLIGKYKNHKGIVSCN